MFAEAGVIHGSARGERGAAPPSPLYPALMAVPKLTPERRQEFGRQAGKRALAGTAMMSDAFGRLTAATEGGDAAAIQEANAPVREGLAQFERGLTRRRALGRNATSGMYVQKMRRAETLVVRFAGGAGARRH